MPRFNLRNLKIGVVGLGYVGLPLAVEFGKRFCTVGSEITGPCANALTVGHDSTLEINEECLVAETCIDRFSQCGSKNWRLIR